MGWVVVLGWVGYKNLFQSSAGSYTVLLLSMTTPFLSSLPSSHLLCEIYKSILKVNWISTSLVMVWWRWAIFIFPFLPTIGWYVHLCISVYTYTCMYYCNTKTSLMSVLVSWALSSFFTCPPLPTTHHHSRLLNPPPPTPHYRIPSHDGPVYFLFILYHMNWKSLM